MIRLHHLRIGRSIFTVWQLEELGIDYELTEYQRNPETFLAPDTLKAIHPLGKSPVIEDGELVLSESSAITTYLLEKFDVEDRFAPPRSDLASWAQFTQWLHYPEGSVFAPLLVKMILLRSRNSHVAFDAYTAREIPLHFDHIARQLGDDDYILGENFSAADFGVCYVVSLGQRLGLLDPWPTLNDYLQRNKTRPAWQRAIARAIE